MMAAARTFSIDVFQQTNRVVAIAQGKITTPDQLDTLARAAIAAKNVGMDRLSIRGFSDQLPSTFSVASYTFSLEGVFKAYAKQFAFWGWNATAVDTSPDRAKIEKRLAQYNPREATAVLEGIECNGYQLAACTHLDASTAAELADLYARYIVRYNKSLDPESLRSLADGRNVVALAKKEGRIVGVLFGICKTYDVNGRLFTLVELDNAVVENGHQNQDLTLGAAFAIERAVDLSAKPHGIIFAEASALCTPVNVCCIEFGFQFAGTLPRHSIMQVRGESERNGNEHLWYRVIR